MASLPYQLLSGIASGCLPLKPYCIINNYYYSSQVLDIRLSLVSESISVILDGSKLLLNPCGFRVAISPQIWIVLVDGGPSSLPITDQLSLASQRIWGFSMLSMPQNSCALAPFIKLEFNLVLDFNLALDRLRGLR